MKIDESWYKKPQNIVESTAAGGVILRKEHDELFVALIVDENFPEDFELPKGGVEAHEDHEAAARREIEEEVGFTHLKKLSYLGEKERLNIKKVHWVTTHYFLFVTEQKIGIQTDTSKLFRLTWFSLNKLPSFLWPEQKELIEENRESIKSLAYGN